MQATALKDEAISLLDSLSASKMRTVIQFVRFIAQQPDDAAEKALSELEGMTFSPKAQTSMDGRAERTQALWRKYESLP